MKVTGPSGPSSPQAARPARASGGFSVSTPGSAVPAGAAASAAGVSGVPGVSALMALQGVEDVTERRRRAIRRGGGLLDRLEELKLALLQGEAGEGALDRLTRTLREERPIDADPGLNSLLDQIDLRAAVELAKADLRRSAA
ncbi:MAG: flagellar assembly protein FliX [Brevundimonas sp.]|uniref:flagellar assembly protein FliX n=1 Tax=Brevundimonas sp. TaxID=1871086 RepID=UPI0027356BFB|nr:flagellar assembly protein FliX [Brevundimonas sp.]MDP3657096.1 flagellar assembly protein FliX [Brevundimonas sp.]MDZ4113093.1 flagellar assembly protein FliX [Brevundimonas sp.]